jgi:hypothetical protein
MYPDAMALAKQYACNSQPPAKRETAQQRSPLASSYKKIIIPKTITALLSVHSSLKITRLASPNCVWRARPHKRHALKAWIAFALSKTSTIQLSKATKLVEEFSHAL